MKRSLLLFLLTIFLFTSSFSEGAFAASKRRTIAGEGQSFFLSKAKLVRYGTPTRYISKSVKGTGVCNNRYFGGDPAPFQHKECSVSKSSKKKKKSGGGGGGGGSSSSKKKPTPPPVVTLPNAPTNLSGTALSSSSVSLTWSASTSTVSSYKVYRDGVFIASTSTTSYTDSGLSANTLYAYQVTAVDSSNQESTKSSVAGVTTQAIQGDTEAPTTPTNLTATAVSSSQINLSWSASTDNVAVSSYEIFRDGTSIATVSYPLTTYQNTGLTQNTTYTYTIRAKDAANNASSQTSGVQATTQVATYALTLTISGTGTVTSSPSGINCTSSCSANFNSGTSVTLTATAGTNYTFTGWSGGVCTGTSTCTTTMSQARSVTATFTQNTYTLSVSKSGTGTVTSSPTGINCGATCSASYNAGTSVTLTASAGANYTFSGWSGACTGTGTCTTTMSQARSVTATFTPNTVQYTLSLTIDGTGTVTSSPAGINCTASCTANFDSGTNVTLTATAGANYTFTGWSGACTGTGTCTTTMSAARSVTATFTANSGSGTVYYISPSGSNSNTCLSSNAPCKTFANVFSKMAAGDELVLLDGTYSSAVGTGSIHWNDGANSAQIPSGTSSRYTYVHAQNPGNVTVNNMLFIGRSFRKDSYIKIQGITFEGGADLYNTDHIYIKDCGFHSTNNEAGGVFNVGSNDGDWGNTNGLFEDIWIWGKERIGLIIYRSNNIVVRRAVIRLDGCDSHSLGCGNNSGNSMVGTTIYNSHHVSFQNVINADNILGSGGYSGGADIQTAWHDNFFFPFGANEWLGNISINSQLGGMYPEVDDMASTYTAYQPLFTFKNTTVAGAVDGVSAQAPSWGNNLRKDLIIDGLTVVGGGSGDALRVGPEYSGTVTSTNYVRNAIALGPARFGSNSVIPPSYMDVNGTFSQGSYNQTSCSSNCYTTNPRSDGTPTSLKYLTRIEAGSYLKGKGYGGADIGANILYKYGTDGTFYGESGYNTLTGNALWPWPNQARIKSQMCAGGVTRGFCSTGKQLNGTDDVTLTSYIWEYLGNPIPASLTDVPSQYALNLTFSGTGTVTSSPSGINCTANCSANFNEGTSVTLTATAGTNYTFSGWSGACTGTGTCTTTMSAVKNVTATFTYSAASAYPWPVWTSAIPVTPVSTTGKTYYVDGTNGSNTNNGLTVGAAFKTIAKAISVIAAGDTVLIKGGLYREGIVSTGSWQGTSTKPITFGSYGDGEVILDGSTKVTGWTVYSGTVWRAPISFTPVGIVVNDVPLKQVRQSPYTSAPAQNLAGVTSGSGKWYYGGGYIYADMGAVDPTTADIVVPNDDGAQEHVYFYGASYINLNGLTIRGSGSNGMWTYDASSSVHSSNITVSNCVFEFNGKAGLVFNGGKDNKALYNYVHDNILINWPRGNGGNAESGGGWPGALNFSGVVRPVARGNIAYHNGGEGIITYGYDTVSGEISGSALFEQNVSYDNWSMNMYVDNQPNGIVRDNILYDHLPDTSEFIYVGTGYPWNEVLEKYRTCMSISDEYGSSPDHNAYNVNTQVYNNLIAGCRIGIMDYGESAPGHGLRNHKILNNTIIMDTHVYQTNNAMGIKIQDNGSNNTSTIIANNIIHGNGINGSGDYNAYFNMSPLILSESSSTLTGVTFRNNLYYSTFPTPFNIGGTAKTTAQWTTFMNETGSVAADPKLVNISSFDGSSGASFSYQSAELQATSPALNVGNSIVSSYLSDDLKLLARPKGATYDIGALEYNQ